MTAPVRPNADGKFPVEMKVKAATIGTAVAGAAFFGVANVLTGEDNKLLLEAIPDSLEWILIPLILALFTAVAGYRAPHQTRAPEEAPSR